jgi:Phosphotransferase enzyme family
MRLTKTLPDDPALPALAAIHTVGLAGAIPALGLGDTPVELALYGYTPGDRATLKARAGDRRFAVKAYAKDPASEAALYEALGAAGLAGDTGVRVPPLLAWERDLRVLVLGWLKGPTAQQLFMGGQGARAGELAARWIERAATLRVNLGPPLDGACMMLKAGRWVEQLRAADPGLGTAATDLFEMLARTQPQEGTRHLVHGTLYARHIFDLGDGPGVIDWQRFGQGPLELDAGMFLATITRLALGYKRLTGEGARAEETFRTGTRGVLDEHALAWHRAAALLRLACKPRTEAAGLGPDDRRAQELATAHALLDEAARPLAQAARPRPIVPAKSRASFIRRRSALELVLQALSTRPATPAELDQIRRLLDETNGGTG